MTRLSADELARRKAQRDEVAAQRRDEYVRRVLADAPPLTSEQRAELRVLLAPAREAIRRLAATRSAPTKR